MKRKQQRLVLWACLLLLVLTHGVAFLQPRQEWRLVVLGAGLAGLVVVMGIGVPAVDLATRGPRIFRRRRVRRRRAAGLCAACGYSLTANVSGVCPECGAPTKKVS